MADGKVTISVDLDGKQAQGGIEKLKGALGGLGSTFKSMLGANLVGGALMSSFNAVAGSVKSVFSSAIDEGAKLQQSLGGIDTLFKNSADTVKNYASNAYKTAGLSANEYMENVTSFSASLISSLGGDTAAAAELANRAMTDMSDNANKMGTDMQAITGTYQSLARGNYAMLDNLKLGYGGTKAEMERLIKDASSYKDIQDELGISVEEGNMSFANMVKAISVVQKKLDITGTTMKEASTTFSGSLSMMKGAFNDFLGNLTTGGDITKPLQALAESAATFLFGNFIPMIGNVFKGLPTALSSFIEAAKPAIVNGLKELLPEEAVNGITKVFDLITYSIDDMVMAFQDFYQGFEKTGAIKALSSALSELLTAGLDLSEKLSGIIPWETIGVAAGHVVKFIAQIIQAVAKFSQSMSGDTWRGVVTGIGGALVAFKAFSFLKSFNPFSFFKKGAEEAIAGTTGSVKRAKSTISQVFSGISNVIKTAGNALKSTFQGMGKMFQGLGKTFEGVGKGIGAVLKGLMQGLRGLNPATLLSFGAAVGIAAVGIGAGITIIAAGFALLASQGEGIAIIVEAVGTAFGTFASMVIGAFADAIVTVSGVLPTIAQSFNMMTPAIMAVGAAISMIIRAFSSLAPVITALGTAISEIVTAITTGVADIATAVTPMVEILSSAFVQVVTVVSQAIVEIIQALAPFIPAVSEMVQAVAPVLQALVEAFNNLISQISPIIDSIANLFKTLGEQITSILDSASGVVESFGSAIRNVLDGIAGIFDSIGNAALNAGKGFNQLAQGIERITKLNLLDMGASLAAVAAGLGAIGATSGGLTSAGSSLSVIVQGLMTVQSVSAIASGSLASLGTVAVSAMSMLVAGVQLAVSGTKSGMNQIVNAISLSANQMIQAGKQAGDGTTKGVVTGIRSGIGQAGGAMHAMMIAIRDTGMQGVSYMRVVGSMISQGLAQGMMSSIGSVTAAANALVAQAERAAKAKAQIHSPSRLFRDAIGRFLPMGVAVGIEKNTKYVDKAMDGMYEHINAFNYKAEDVIGVGKTKLSKVVQVKSDLESAIKATVEVAKEKSNELLAKALDVAEKAVERPAEMRLDDGTLVAKTGDKFSSYQSEQLRRENRMKGIIT
ncbi:phage tail protein [Streptococcus suis]|uniref:phage tail protein n=1 Tax=Streptococcus suis TaxID=1307 RepID=UPI00403C7045